jgi:N utilization substance protein B
MIGARGEALQAARLAAVQALYQMELSEIGDEAVIREFEEHRFGRTERAANSPKADQQHFERVVRGVIARQHEIDTNVDAVLKAGWPLDRLDATVRAILRCAAFELLACADIPARVALNEYIEIAHAFFSGEEPSLINGVLDQLARRARGEDALGPERT